MEIRKYQKSTDLLIRRLPFSRLVGPFDSALGGTRPGWVGGIEGGGVSRCCSLPKPRCPLHARSARPPTT
jgi:hypothetical protein